MTWAAASSARAIACGLVLIASGLLYVAVARSDFGRTARSVEERFLARRFGAAGARKLVEHGRRMSVVSRRVLGWAFVVAGAVFVVVVGLVGVIVEGQTTPARPDKLS